LPADFVEPLLVAVVAAVAVVVFVAAGLDQEAATRSREPALGPLEVAQPWEEDLHSLDSLPSPATTSSTRFSLNSLVGLLQPEILSLQSAMQS